MKSMIKAALAAAALMAAASSVHAQSYAGALVQMSRFNLGSECASLGTDADCDKSANGLKLFAGSTLSDDWRIEAAYIDFGKTKSTVDNASVKVSASALVAAAAVTFHPLPALTLSGKVGIAAVTAKVDGDGESLDEQHPSLYLGLGVDYEVYKNVRAVLGVDFVRARVAEDKFGIQSVGLGAQMAF